jgi:uncharacterized membrane protein
MKGILWNLMLAAIPVAMAYGLAWGLGGRGKQRNLPLWVCIPLALAWLAFLPNTCYLLTEWRHLLFDPQWADLFDVAVSDRRAMLSIAKWALFFLSYSGLGVLSFVLAIRPLEQWFLSRRGKPWMVAPFLFFLTSLGVYLGLIVRLNSWDLLNRPMFVWDTAIAALTRPAYLNAILVFAGILWALYEAVDIWVEGIEARLRRMGILSSTVRVRSATHA